MVTSRSPRSTRPQQINLRVSDFQRELLDHAAHVQGKNRTDFILDAAVQEARATIEAQATLLVDEPTFESFRLAIEAPIPSTGELKKLFSTKAPWE